MPITRLSATDGIWLSLESPDMPMHIAFLLEFTMPEGSAAHFVRRWRARLAAPVSVPRPWNLVPIRGPLTRLSLMRETEEIDPAEHIRSWRLSRPGDRKELIDLATRIHGEQLDFRRPPWEIHLIEGLAEDRFAVIVKVHHSLFDGVSLMRLFTETFTENAEDRGVADLFTVGRSDGTERSSGVQKGSIQALVVALRGLFHLLGGIGRAGRDALRRLRGDETLAQKAYQQPPSILNGPITGARELSLRRYDLALLKRLAKAGDCTINDLVLYLVSTALRTYLTEHAELPERSLTAGVPIDLREGNDDRVGTRAGMMFTSLGTDIADPLERLTAVKEYIDAAKRQMTTMPANTVIGYGLAVTLPWILGLTLGFGNTPSSHPMGISNVPGPQKPLYWNGARLEALYPISLLMHGNPFNVTCLGYTDAIHFGVLGASDKLPPIRYVTDAMDAALDELTDLLLSEREQTMRSAG
ncbi:wax ester/triacylglycerol synthase family O-acyltransferase [Nocardia sp. 004]|uniref:wax ester/triacylglycerol synthase family O-acyltransferase n=1 Tax=Nocardia sp. 004 TaxID=3385978 RepID=UPI00399F1A8E